MRADWDKALTHLQRGNQAKALRLIREALARHGQGSPLLLRALGTVHSRAAAVTNDPSVRARHHRDALQAARRAVELAPDSLELSHFRALLLYEAASDGRAYDEVITESERGLSIKVPSDPAPHSLCLPAADLDYIRAELRTLIQKANLASISLWVKTLGGPGDDKVFDFFPMPDDSVELHPLPAAPVPRWANEIKKATKTPEERRKEVEVQLAAMRLVEQQQLLQASAASSSPPQSEGDEDEPPCSSPQCDVGLWRA
jgi:tetratricopeptide (TPR) repeat protein